jgi:hypothetical protein
LLLFRATGNSSISTTATFKSGFPNNAATFLYSKELSEVTRSYRDPVDVADGILNEEEHKESLFQASDDETVRPPLTQYAMRGL